MDSSDSDRGKESNLNKKMDSSLQLAAPRSLPNIPTWAWVLGSILTLTLPFWKKKLKGLLRLEAGLEKAAKAVENVAEQAERVLKEVADELPDGGKLKESVMFVENVIEGAYKDAELTTGLIQQVDEIIDQEVGHDQRKITAGESKP